MEEKSTSKLMNLLQNTKKAGLAGLKQDLTVHSYSFFVYMDEIISKKNLKRQDIFQKADLPQKYGYKLLSGESHTKDRDKLLRIFIAMGMNLKEVQRALALYGMPVLYPKKQRDAVLIIAINEGITSVDTVNEWLLEYGEKELSRSEDEKSRK